MPIFVAPDRTRYPPTLQTKICNELEALTGADLAISNFPLSPKNEIRLRSHIKSDALFVQIKIGYDALSFNALRNFCARVQERQIPTRQAILLFIGEFWKDENGLFRLKGSKAYSDTTWRDWRRLLMSSLGRGVTVFPEILSSIDELPEWIEDYRSILEKFKREGKRHIYPERPVPVFECDNPWQLIEEVPENTIDYLLCAGRKGIGQKTITACRDYLSESHPDIPPTGIHLLKCLIDINEKGKPLEDIKGWGQKSMQSFRDLLMIPDGYNLELVPLEQQPSDYLTGWHAALDKLLELIEDNKSVKEAFNETRDLGKNIIIEF